LLDGFEGTRLTFKPTLKASLDEADRVYNGINATIDKYIAEQGIAAPPASVYAAPWEPADEPASLDLHAARISAIVWCIGLRPDFSWLDAAVFTGTGHPKHHRGVTTQPGLYFVGLPWLHTWGSGRFSGVARDARYIAEHIEARFEARAGSLAAPTPDYRGEALSL
jgi:putative flavoprotein involved in K+ transport